MYNLITILLLSLALNTPQGPAKDTEKKVKVLVDGEWVEKPLDTQPKFGTTELDMGRFIAQSIRYPIQAQRAGISGMTLITAEITEDGRIVNEKIEKGFRAGLGEESLRVVQLLPDTWTPATLDRKPVRTQITIPVRFTIKK
jgi:TonB family protein